MTRSQSLWKVLTTDTTVAALVGTRVFPLVALPGFDTLVIQKWDVTCDYTLSSVGEVSASLEIRCWANDYELAHAIADAVHAVLSPAGVPGGFRGLLGGTGGIDVTQCLWAANGSRETDSVVTLTPDKFMFEVLSPYELTYNL